MEKVPGESTDHEHQRGVWIGAESVSGLDFWENEKSYDRPNKGTVALTSITDVRSGARSGRFTLRATWHAPDGEPRIVETRMMTFGAEDQRRTVDVDLRLTAKTPMTFADNHDAVLGLRLGTAFEEGHGGRAWRSWTIPRTSASRRHGTCATTRCCSPARSRRETTRRSGYRRAPVCRSSSMMAAISSRTVRTIRA
jgi:hypothetical protein